LSPRLRSLSAIVRALRPCQSLEDFLSACQNFVERILKIGRALGKLLSNLRNILLKALFYLLTKELLQSPIAQTFGVLRRMVGDDVRDQRASKSFGALAGILGKKWIERATRSCIADRC
jgi:hypothetical protein